MSEDSDINTKFKTLYDVAFHEYKDECERSKRIDEKVGRIFTVLNIFIVLAITAVTKNEYWTNFKTHNIFFQTFEIFILILFFSFLFFAWSKLLSAMQDNEIKKIELNHQLEDLVYEDEKNANYLYWTIYRTYRRSLEQNTVHMNLRSKTIEDSLKDLKKAFWCFVSFIFILFLTLLKSIVES
ncbi:TPA: hypothetical protein JI086_17695 [Acinetobacter baumannii]|nr:hypothetical protein [Acinetobacter baumannii]